MQYRKDLFGSLWNELFTRLVFTILLPIFDPRKNCSEDFHQTFRTIRCGLYLGLQGGLYIWDIPIF